MLQSIFFSDDVKETMKKMPTPLFDQPIKFADLVLLKY